MNAPLSNTHADPEYGLIAHTLREAELQEFVTAILTPRASALKATLGDYGVPVRQLTWRGGNLAYVVVGLGPVVVLTHGWEGAASDLLPIVKSLVDAGYRCVLWDLPAHGESSGAWTSIPHSAQALQRLADHVGPVYATVSHSVGSAVTVQALSTGLHCDRSVLISPPGRYMDFVEHIAAQFGFAGDDLQRIVDILAERGVDAPALNLPNEVQAFEHAGLFVHADNDRVCDVRWSRLGHAAWQNSSLMEFPGLGHRRILSDPAVVTSVTGFLAQDW
ncbi:alpha/beta hydrolase [Limnobacter humi]|uniref:Alpha/beta hydrolase n=1 Tax=Limnobacter humi TaxID=1778671 RepID=A0ABT1WI92_9BURK|nr:alpha/beta hydrolase [Limnobacter humi]MCQ8896437.1 alpha/beta hydrolase [Limnobacter humi]